MTQKTNHSPSCTKLLCYDPKLECIKPAADNCASTRENGGAQISYETTDMEERHHIHWLRSVSVVLVTDGLL